MLPPPSSNHVDRNVLTPEAKTIYRLLHATRKLSRDLDRSCRRQNLIAGVVTILSGRLLIAPLQPPRARIPIIRILLPCVVRAAISFFLNPLPNPARGIHRILPLTQGLPYLKGSQPNPRGNLFQIRRREVSLFPALSIKVN